VKGRALRSDDGRRDGHGGRGWRRQRERGRTDGVDVDVHAGDRLLLPGRKESSRRLVVSELDEAAALRRIRVHGRFGGVVVLRRLTGLRRRRRAARRCRGRRVEVAAIDGEGVCRLLSLEDARFCEALLAALLLALHRVPTVLDCVVRAPRKHLDDLGPARAVELHGLDDGAVLVVRPLVLAHLRGEVVVPALAALLAGAAFHLVANHRPAHLRAALGNQLAQLPVLSSCPDVLLPRALVAIVVIVIAGEVLARG